jgi:hypothetical protein
MSFKVNLPVALTQPAFPFHSNAQRPLSQQWQGDRVTGRGITRWPSASAKNRHRQWHAVTSAGEGGKGEAKGCILQQEKRKESAVLFESLQHVPLGVPLADTNVCSEIQNSPNAHVVATFHGGSFVHFMEKVRHASPSSAFP